MDKIMVYGILCAITLAAMFFFAMNADQWRSRKMAKIRVRVDMQQRGGLREPQEDEFEDAHAVKWLSVGAALVLLFVLLSRA